jgi:hypothetical protein
LGSWDSADARENLIREVNAWNGGVIVLKDSAMHELSGSGSESWQHWGDALKALVARTKASGLLVIEAEAPEPRQGEVIRELLQNPANRGASYLVTGAWVFSDESGGCVLSVHNAIIRMGFKAEISENALRDNVWGGVDDEHERFELVDTHYDDEPYD